MHAYSEAHSKQSSAKRPKGKAQESSPTDGKDRARTRLIDALTSTLSPVQRAVWADLEETDCDLTILAKMLVADLVQMQADYQGGAGARIYYSQRRDHIELLRKITQTIHETSQGGPSELTVHVEGLYQSAGSYSPDGKPTVTTTEVDQ